MAAKRVYQMFEPWVEETDCSSGQQEQCDCEECESPRLAKRPRRSRVSVIPDIAEDDAFAGIAQDDALVETADAPTPAVDILALDPALESASTKVTSTEPSSTRVLSAP